MFDVLTGIRQMLSLAAEQANAAKRLYETGLLDLGNLGLTVETAKNAGVYGPQASMAIQGGRKYANLPAIVDERGTLTYREVDDQSWALAHGLRKLGVSEGSVVGLLCRDHRGLVIAMATCGKLGARLVLMNTGFAKPQFAEVCERENVTVVLHDSEFLGLLDALPPNCRGCSPGWTRMPSFPRPRRHSTTSSRRTPPSRSPRRGRRGDRSSSPAAPPACRRERRATRCRRLRQRRSSTESRSPARERWSSCRRSSTAPDGPPTR